MKKRFFSRSLLISLIAILIFALCSSIIVFKVNQNQQIANLDLFLSTVTHYDELSDDYQTQAETIADLYGTDSDLRITIINLDGTVLADSEADAAEMENHSDREEVMEAIKTGEGSSVRYSSTLNKTVLYVAIKTEQNVILRGMLPISGVFAELLNLLPVIILSAILSMIVTYFVAKKFAKDAVRPLEHVNNSITKMVNNDFSLKVPYSDYEELNDLIKNVNLLSKTIQSYMYDVTSEKEKLTFILNNISQGVILLDENYNIIHSNQSAKRIFNVKEDENLTLFNFTRKNTVINAVEKARTKRPSHFELTSYSNQEIYSVSVLPIHAKDYENNIFIILTDITQSKNNEKMRKEFFSNASHELKTPITSIMGFSELIINNFEEDMQNIKEYANIIHKESEKLSALLDDILTISSLEEKSYKKTTETVEVNEAIQDVTNELSLVSDSKNIAVHFDPKQPAVLLMEKKDFESAMRNLIENAIKYGKQNGNIWIDTAMKEGQLRIEVKDDGIGMEHADVMRIFERFYRVDKSRNNKKTKGTGIGLSIVKHIMIKYGGTINVISALDKGSTFILEFPNLKKS
jgi:two-component system phosphate regulon sensor histidine kinase PhoR